MNKTKHARGPWVPVKDGTFGFDIVTNDGARVLVALVYGEHSPVGECNPAQAYADANLIAAAPDLLAACEALLAVSLEPGIQDVDEWKHAKREADIQAQAAIAKATAQILVDRPAPGDTVEP